MKNIVSPTQVKASFDAHSVIGLCTGVLLYLICLTGTLAVFTDYFERWEQPLVAEFSGYDSQTITTAMQGHRQHTGGFANSLFVVLPSDSKPRMHVSGDSKEWYVRSDGSMDEPIVEGWTHMLRALHYYLHLPATLGLLITGVLGAVLLALIISGLIAHPRIFKDAFTLRLGGTRRLEQADIHNRLSVWGLPFYLMVGITGAFFGLFGSLLYVSATAFYGGDRQALIEDIYGADPSLDAPVVALDIARALETQKQRHPQTNPIFIVAHKLGTREQFLEIGATLPKRLLYAEMYRYTVDGHYLGQQGFEDGPLGLQILYSTYRLHFGYYGSIWVRVVYSVMGLALTVIVASGINIWLARQSGRSWANDIWTATVWGIPLGLSCAAIASVILNLSALMSFMAISLLAMIFCLHQKNAHRSATTLQGLLSLSLLTLSAGFFIRFPDAVARPLGVSMAIVFIGLAIGILLIMKACKHTLSRP